MTHASPWQIIRLVAALLLGTIGLQALSNDAEMLDQHRQGSAFSASTVDVALFSSPRETVANSVELPQPNVPPLALISDRISWKLAAQEERGTARPDPVGPVSADFLTLNLVPRPPPIS